MLSDIARGVREYHQIATYDHRPFLPAGLPDYYQGEEFRSGYACFKWAVAHVIKPSVIIEIGVGVGVSAMAFCAGWPDTHYMGIDNDCENGRNFPVKPSEFVARLLGRDCVQVADSTKIDRIAQADLVHIDGAHDYDSCYLDVLLAWRSGARWILVDDARDSVVAAATFDALRFKSPGSIDWAYFEDTYTGNLLISRSKERP